MSGRVLHRRADQAEEVPLDPLAREVVRNREGEGVVGELRAFRVGEPGAEGRFVESPPEPLRDFVPHPVRSQLDLVLHACLCPLVRLTGRREHSSVFGSAQSLDGG